MFKRGREPEGERGSTVVYFPQQQEKEKGKYQLMVGDRTHAIPRLPPDPPPPRCSLKSHCPPPRGKTFGFKAALI